MKNMKIKYSRNVSLGLDYILSNIPDKTDLRFARQAMKAAYRSAAYHGLSVDELANYYIQLAQRGKEN